MDSARVFRPKRPTRRISPRNQRGAALLLMIYFCALTLLLLSGVALQRTSIDMHAAQISRDLQQAYWGTEAAFDRSLVSLRASDLGTPDTLGCWYTMLPLDDTTGQRGSSMFCQTDNPAQFQVEMAGTGNRLSMPVLWASAFIQRDIPQFSPTGALTAQEGVKVAHALIGSSDTLLRPIGLNSLGTDGFGDYLPQLLTMGGTATGSSLFVGNRGNIASASPEPGAITIEEGSQVLGEVRARNQMGVSISDDSHHVETAVSTTSNTPLTFPAVREPNNATDLVSVLPQTLRLLQANSQGVEISGSTVQIPAGTYKTNDLVIKDGSTVTANGPVDLFVHGSLTVKKSQVYGADPATTSQYDPKLLRIYAHPAQKDDQVLISNGALFGGLIYAPSMPVKVKRKAIVLGAIVGRRIEAGTQHAEADAYADNGPKVQVLYDAQLGRQLVTPSPVDPEVKLLLYRINKTFSEASARPPIEQERLLRWWEFINGQDPAFAARFRPLYAAVGGSAAGPAPVPPVVTPPVTPITTPIGPGVCVMCGPPPPPPPPPPAPGFGGLANGVYTITNTDGSKTTIIIYDKTVVTEGNKSSSAKAASVTYTPSVICTELHRQGYLPTAWFEADMAFGRAYADGRTFAVYHAWARPVVRAMQRSALVTQLVRPFALAWAKHMAYVMGAGSEDSLLGRWLVDVGLPLHRALGAFLVEHGLLQPEFYKPGGRFFCSHQTKNRPPFCDSPPAATDRSSLTRCWS